MSRTKTSAGHVVRAIAVRQLRIAWRTRMVKIALALSLIPVLVDGVSIFVRVTTEETFGVSVPWDALVQFLQAQTAMLSLVAIAIGVPAVARDRSEDVLFLYATRPVRPWHYTAGKVLSTAVPATLLLLVPGLLLGLLRWTLLPGFGAAEIAVFTLRISLASVFIGAGVAGLCVGLGAAVKSTRWGYFLAVAGLFIIDSMIGGATLGRAVPFGPYAAGDRLIAAVFESGRLGEVLWAVSVLTIWFALGTLGTAGRVRKEMVP